MSNVAFLPREQDDASFVALLNKDRSVRFLSPGALTFLGWDLGIPSEVALDPVAAVHPDDQARARARLVELFSVEGVTVTETVRVVVGSGEVRRIRVSATHRCHDPALGCVVASFREVTVQDADQAALRQLAAAAHHLPDRVVITDAAGLITYVNPAFERRTGYAAEEALGHTPGSLLKSGHHGAAFYEELWATISAGRVFRAEFVNRARTGALFREEATIAPVPDPDGVIRHYVLCGRDVTELRRLQADLETMALVDPLTGLPNRRAFQDQAALTVASRRLTAVLCVGIDRFKVVNDALGHSVGDAVLVEVARRLRGVLRPSDLLGRLGGDEFCVLLDGASGQAGAAVGERIAHTLLGAIRVDSHALHVRASIGLAACPEDGGNVEDLLARASTAMYRAKRTRAGFARFDGALDPASAARATFEAALHEALVCDQFRLRYQPIVEVVSGRVTHFEALARWQHPARGELAPGEFLPLVEEAGLALAFDRCILGQAARQLRVWREEGDGSQRVAINLASSTFQHAGLVGWVESAVAEHGLERGQLSLEITETAAMSDAGEAARQMRALADRGVATVLDDFGTGYSSLSYLKHFSVKLLKIDRSFVSGIGVDGKDERLVEAIVHLAQRLEIGVVAEGVETVAQLSWLRGAGCDLAQGYLFARPMKPGDVPPWLHERARDAGI